MRAAAFLFCLVASTALFGVAAQPAPAPPWSPASQYGDAWSPALGAWLPSFGELDEPWRHDQATRIAQRDGFVYEGNSLLKGYWGHLGRVDGTHFVYGSAGPPRGHVVYDPVHRIAFYEQGCCSFDEVVASADAAPPPKRVVARDLSDLHTVRGIHFGDTSTAVMHIYGKSALLPVKGHPGFEMLAYTTWPPFKSLTNVNSPCGQMQNFIFRGDRVVFIQFENGC